MFQYEQRPLAHFRDQNRFARSFEKALEQREIDFRRYCQTNMDPARRTSTIRSRCTRSNKRISNNISLMASWMQRGRRAPRVYEETAES